jgi:hypothetical protein
MTGCPIGPILTPSAPSSPTKTTPCAAISVALSMEAVVKQYAEELQRTHGVPMKTPVGLTAGEVVVRSIGNDLHMGYLARQQAGAGGCAVNLLGS